MTDKNSTETRFNTALAGYRDAVTAAKRAHFAGNGYTFATPSAEVKSLGRRFAKLVDVETWDHDRREGGVHSFVEIETGLIFKAASYRAPAKHARGSIYENDGRGALTDTGCVRYMR